MRGDEVEPAAPQSGAVVEEALFYGRQRRGAAAGAAEEEGRGARALRHERHFLLLPCFIIGELRVEVDGDAVRVAALGELLGSGGLGGLRDGDGEDVEAEAGDADGREGDRAGGLAASAGLH